MDAAEPGDTIVVYGTHRENVAIETDGLTLRGVGAVIRPPATPAVHGCFDPTQVGEAVHGICAVGDVDFDTGAIFRYVKDVTVRGFTVRGFPGFGVAATAASHALFKDNVTSNNRDAGIFAAQSLDTRILANRASAPSPRTRCTTTVSAPCCSARRPSIASPPTGPPEHAGLPCGPR